MAYDVAKDPYIDQATGVIRNKLGITTASDLQSAEAEITYVIIATMKLSKSYRLKDFTHQPFLDVHKNIFGDIYDWAGTTRTIDIGKDNSYFAHAAYVDSALAELFTALTQDSRFTSDNKDVFVEAVTHYHSELNAIHPFREGNGRVIRTFLSLLAENRGWQIDWSNLDQEENIEAAKRAFVGDLDKLYKIIHGRVTRG